MDTIESTSKGRKHSGLSFWSHDGSSLVKNMLINRNGNVGIGTDNPVAKLEIDMDLTSHNNLSFRNLDISGVFRNTDETWLQEKITC